MNNYLDENHIFVKNPQRAADFFSFAWTLLADKSAPDYEQLKDILSELKRLPAPFKFDLNICSQEADKWQRHFPNVNIPKIIASYGSQLRDEKKAKEYGNHYGMIWIFLQNAEKKKEAPREYKRTSPEHAPAVLDKPIYQPGKEPGWQMDELKRIIKENFRGNYEGMDIGKIF